MSNKKISYLSRNFEDYRASFLELLKNYYPEIANDFNDASIGSWLVDLIAAASDNLSYHIDRMYNETSVDSAQLKSSIYAMARTNGFKIPGPKGAMVEVVFKCQTSTTTNIGLKIKRGTKISSGRHVFELMEDLDFDEQYNSNGVSDRVIAPLYNSNGVSNGYVISKTGIAVAGETKIYKQILRRSDIKPFMEILIPDDNIMNVESIITKEGTNHTNIPIDDEFYIDCESAGTMERFFEVSSFLEQYRWADNGEITKYGGRIIHSGKWEPLYRKFITEYTNKGHLKVIFGAGDDNNNDTNETEIQKQIARMVNNTSMGLLPKVGNTLFIRYRAGGGKGSNVAANSLRNITYLNVDCTDDNIRKTITVTNPSASMSGKDIPTVDELRNMIKYHTASQERCVTLRDYEDRVAKMPAKYGAPFRCAATEENNKVLMYMLGIGSDGKLSSSLPQKLIDNVISYLSMYRTINDYVEIKSGRIINISVEADIFVDKNYDVANIVEKVINVVKDYMDINKHYLGEDIFIGDMQRAISDIDGILNLIDVRIYNETGNGYSPVKTSQETVDFRNTEGESGGDADETHKQIDMVASDYVLISDADCMFEIKYPEKDVKVRVKQR